MSQAIQKAYEESNKVLQEERKAYQDAIKQKTKERKKEWREANKEKIKAQEKAYREANKNARDATGQRYVERKKAMKSPDRSTPLTWQRQFLYP